MQFLSGKRDYGEDSMLELAQSHLSKPGDVVTIEDITQILVQAVSLPRIKEPAAAVRQLLEKFLNCLPLDRLLHLLDLVLPQMTPVLDRCAGQGRERLQCHVARLRDADRASNSFNGRWANDIRFSVQFQFFSYPGIVHMSAVWHGLPLLLFTDKYNIPYLEEPSVYKDSQVLDNYRRGLQLGLRVGQAILIQYEASGSKQSGC